MGVICSGCGTAIEKLSIFGKKCLYLEDLNIESRVGKRYIWYAHNYW